MECHICVDCWVSGSQDLITGMIITVVCTVGTYECMYSLSLLRAISRLSFAGAA
jgi:hypothetical protein